MLQAQANEDDLVAEAETTPQEYPSIRAKHDPVNHPDHYTAHPSGIECIDVVRHLTFNIGNAMKYLWRAGLKQEDQKSSPEIKRNKHIQDLRKAIWYINDEIVRLEKKDV